MKIQESAENYLETILMLTNRNSFVRSIDIASELAVTKPSVSIAMKAFREEGYIEVDGDGHITLTEKGMAIAEKVYDRHRVIAEFFISLGVSEKTAYEDSCKIEHYISEESYMKIKQYLGRA